MKYFIVLCLCLVGCNSPDERVYNYAELKQQMEDCYSTGGRTFMRDMTMGQLHNYCVYAEPSSD